MHDDPRPCAWPALLALALCGSPAHGAPEKMKVDPSKVQTVLFLREGPAESSRALGKLAPGTAVIALGPKENGFLKLSTPESKKDERPLLAVRALPGTGGASPRGARALVHGLSPVE